MHKAIAEKLNATNLRSEDVADMLAVGQQVPSRRTVGRLLKKIKGVQARPTDPKVHERIKWGQATLIEEHVIKLADGAERVGVVGFDAATGATVLRDTGMVVFADETQLNLEWARFTSLLATSSTRRVSVLTKVLGLGSKHCSLMIGYRGNGDPMGLAIITSVQLEPTLKAELESLMSIQRHSDGVVMPGNNNCCRAYRGLTQRILGLIWHTDSGGMEKDAFGPFMAEWAFLSFKGDMEHDKLRDERGIAPLWIVVDGVQTHLKMFNLRLNCLAKGFTVHLTLHVPNLTALLQGDDTWIYMLLKGGHHGGQLGKARRPVSSKRGEN